MNSLQDDWQDRLTALFCAVDDFCNSRPVPPPAPGKRRRARALCDSEIVTLLIAFHQSQCRCFKAFYLGYVRRHLTAEFPRLVSYPRFVAWVPSVVRLLCDYLYSLLGTSLGVAYLDSTALPVCHNKRIAQHKVFKNQAERGKTSVGWFYGFKLHVVINHQGELLAVQVTPGNTSDTKPVDTLLRGLLGKVFADKGYLSQPLKDRLKAVGIDLITKVKKEHETAGTLRGRHVPLGQARPCRDGDRPDQEPVSSPAHPAPRRQWLCVQPDGKLDCLLSPDQEAPA